MGVALLKSPAHALRSKMLGPELAGEFESKLDDAQFSGESEPAEPVALLRGSRETTKAPRGRLQGRSEDDQRFVG